ncbi:GNAT family N-acetyltransferase [Actinomadura meridiana]|uniref:GNAT family N-acetyltransferase n=1 Tax=Actinomadura meridiana TaxID=559626 RepID=A0ABP8CKW2_9ACTN
MTESVVVRQARADEYELIGELTVEVYVAGGLVSAASSYVGTLRDAAARAVATELLVAEIGGEVGGAVAYCPPGSAYGELAGPDEAEFRMLAVRDKARGRGVGRALVHRCLDRARTTGLSGVRLSTQRNMVDAHRLYERMGFVRTPDRDWAPVPGVDLLTYAFAF